MSKLQATHHVAIICSDIERSRQFYSEVLGFPVVNETFREKRSSHKVDLQIGDGTFLELFTFPSSPPRPSYPEACGLRHIAFSVQDIDCAIESLKRGGIDVEDIRVDQHTGCRFTFLADPDGQPIELYELSTTNNLQCRTTMPKNVALSDFVAESTGFKDIGSSQPPWAVIESIFSIVQGLVSQASSEHSCEGGIFIHPDAKVETGAIIKAPAFVSSGCFVAAHAYLRDGVYLGPDVTVGPGCEVKSSLLFSNTHLAHLNFVGNSVIGSGVNFEAGAHTANHWNERQQKEIRVATQSGPVATGLTKFGAIVGDNSRIGANAVLSPGTLLGVGSIVGRLELVNQLG